MGVFRFGGDYYGIRGSQKENPYAMGGTITEVNGYRIHTFTDVGPDSIAFTEGGNVEYLIVAGGGGGGGDLAGGGGGGGLLSGSTLVFPAIYSTSVGSGGTGGGGNRPSSPNPTQGSKSLQRDQIS